MMPYQVILILRIGIHFVWCRLFHKKHHYLKCKGYVGQYIHRCNKCGLQWTSNYP